MNYLFITSQHSSSFYQANKSQAKRGSLMNNSYNKASQSISAGCLAMRWVPSLT